VTGGAAASGALAPHSRRRGVNERWPATRVLAGAIGAGSVAVGAFQYAAPWRAARRFGFQLGSDPSSTIMIRGAGGRDLVAGLVLLCTAACDGNYGHGSRCVPQRTLRTPSPAGCL